jgi:hypothetical protein
MSTLSKFGGATAGKGVRDGGWFWRTEADRVGSGGELDHARGETVADAHFDLAGLFTGAQLGYGAVFDAARVSRGWSDRRHFGCRP